MQITRWSAVSASGDGAGGFTFDADVLRVNAIRHFPTRMATRSQLLLSAWFMPQMNEFMKEQMNEWIS